MRKAIYILIIILYAIWGCEKIPTGVVDNRDDGYQVTALKAPLEISYHNDSSSVTSLRIENSGNIEEIWMDITYSGKTNIFSHINLLDNGNLQNADSVKGDNIFSARVYFSRTDLNGNYTASYYAQAEGEVNPIAVHKFNYSNGEAIHTPVISDLTMPDTVSVGEQFVFTVKAFSPSGLKEIKNVFFKFVRSDGTVSDVFLMHDDGNKETFGDEISGDGIYSFKNSFSQAVQGQSRKFIFQAVSQNDLLSNIITHNIYIK